MNSMNKLIKATALMLLSVAVLPAAQAQPDSNPLLAQHPELREVLREEMRSLLEGLQRINIALPQGQWQTVAEQAEAMHDSYILKQHLSADERKTLRRLLPIDFIQMDKQFHDYAGRLQNAARQQDAELSVYFLSRITEACVQCHRRFAPDRFPGLSASPTPPAETR